MSELKRKIDDMSEQEIKPAISEWKIRDVYFDEEGEPAAHRALPDTHRIVPVEHLRTVLGVAYIMRQYLRKDSDAIKQMDELQAIADEKD